MTYESLCFLQKGKECLSRTNLEQVLFRLLFPEIGGEKNKYGENFETARQHGEGQNPFARCGNQGE